MERRLLNSRLLLRTLVFLLPVQLGLHFWPSWAYVFGIRVDYFSPTIYLTDTLVFIFVIFTHFHNTKQFSRVFLKRKRIIFLLALFAILNTLVSKEPTLAAFKWLKVAELVLFAAAISISRFDFKADFLKPLSLSLIMISLIGILQFMKGGSLGGFLYLLGERSFNQSTPGIALSQFSGREYLRPYSVFSHPNSLAGYLVVSSILLLGSKIGNFKGRVLLLTSLVLSGIVLILAYSIGSFMTIVALIFLLIVTDKKWLSRVLTLLLFASISFSILFIIYSSEMFNFSYFDSSTAERLWFNRAAGETFVGSPIFGVGLNNFIATVTKLDIPAFLSWKLQPVHNIFLLVLAEAGLIGIMAFFYLLLKAFRHLFEISNLTLEIAFLSVILTGMVDHYWLTLQQNQLLFALLIGLSFNKFIINQKASS
ncbi:O-antigen ligase family protein [Candidatus Woesebacteria bacterium]|nr:O-antigen ligase family protein [Candidatus Woesebacteria bacterium]